MDDPKIYSATYSSVPVYEFKVNGDSVMRRRADDWINATHILKLAGFDKPARTRILEREVQKGVHEKVQGGYGKYQGTWIPLPDGRMLAERNNILDKLRPIFDYVAGDRSPPPAPKHTSAASRQKVPKAAPNRRVVQNESGFQPINKPPGSMGPPSFHPEQYEANPSYEEEDTMEQTTLETSSIIGDEDMLQLSQQSNYSSRKRKRGMDQVTAMSIIEQEHTLYGDQLLDYFMTVGDAPEATRIRPPEPPTNFQVDRPIDDSGNTALHWACAMGDLEIVRDLLRRGADMRALSVHEETPLVRSVLFTNNYEKRTFPTLLEYLLDTISFRDWFGATIFHHLAETTRSKGKWKSSRYYCEVLLEKLRSTFTPEEVDLLLSCQDSNGDSAALVAARNGAFRLVNLLLMHCPRAGDLVNKKGETATSILRQSEHVDRDVPPPPSSVIMGTEQVDGDAGGAVSPNQQASTNAQNASPVTSALLSKIGSIMSEANKKLAVTYGNTKPTSSDPDDVANPEALYEQLESDRQKMQAESIALSAKESASEPIDAQLKRYDGLRSKYESLLEQIQRAQIIERVAKAVTASGGAQPKPESLSQEEMLHIYQVARQLCTVQKERHTALKELIQQTADAGVSTKLDVHRKLVSLATGLKEEELDPMSAELAETLEFDRLNGKGPGAESPEPETTRRQLSQKNPGLYSVPGPTVPVDA